LAFNGGGLNYFIGNPNSKSDIFVNPNEQTFSGVDETPNPCAAFGGQPSGAFDWLSEQQSTIPSCQRSGSRALGLPANCIDSINQPTPYRRDVAIRWNCLGAPVSLGKLTAWMMLNPDYDPATNPTAPNTFQGWLPIRGEFKRTEADTYKGSKARI